MIRANAPASYSYGYGVFAAATLGYFLLRIPVQVTDSFLNILALDRPFGELVLDMLTEPGYLRPGLWATMKVVYDLSGGDYFTWYRGTHVVQVVLLILLFVRLLQPTTATAAALVPLALAVLVGSHTFAWTVLEAFPINTFLTVVLACVAAANLSFARPRWWIDVLALVLFSVMALTLESGLLVWVVFVAGFLLGLRGVSRRAIVVLIALLAAYFWLRFVWLDIGSPSLVDREAGFGFTRLTGDELQEMFGGNPYAFYAYNVVCSVWNVLLGEPRDGVWHLTRSIVEGGPNYWLAAQVSASLLATALVCRYLWIRRHAWMERRLDRGDQLVLMFVAVLAANAVLSYGYTKDVIMSPAGAFFAVAVFVACRDFLESRAGAGRAAMAAAALVLVVVSSTWAVRVVGMHVALNQMAVEVRDQWAYIDDFLARRNRQQLTPRELAVMHALQDDAVRRRPAAPPLLNALVRVFGM